VDTGPEATTVGDVMLRARSSVPQGLIRPEELERVAAYGRLLPARAVRAFAYEVRLGEDRRVDSSYGLFDAASALAAGERLVAARRDRASPAALAAWEGLLAVMRAWAAGTGPIGRGLRVLMLELDAVDPADALPLPLIFWHATKDWGPAALEHLGMLEEILGMLAAPPSMLGRAREAFRLGYVEAGGREPTFGFALGRSPRVLRLLFDGPDPARAVPVLQALGWEGAAPALLQLLGQLVPAKPELVLSVDVAGDQVLPRVGVDVFRSGRGPLAPALDVLERFGLCAAEKARAIRALDDGWQWYATSSAPEAEVLGRRVSHYKVIFAGSAPTEAKVYLRYAYRDRRQP